MKLFIITALMFSSFAFAKTYKIEKSSQLGFSIFKFKINEAIKGKFTEFSGTFDYDEKTKKISNINVTIDAKSINTDNEKRDGHLRADDFFGVEKYPSITFKSVGPYSVKKDFSVKGDLTMRDKTLKEELKIKNYKSKNGMHSFDIEGAIDRYKYGVSWNSRMDKKQESFIDRVKNAAKGLVGKYVIGNKVDLKIKIEAK